MHPSFVKADKLTKEVIGAAIEVHRSIGAGLLESIYENCLMRELEIRNIPYKNQVMVPIQYKGYKFEHNLKLDLYIDDCLIIELKSIEKVLPIHKAQLLSYMKLLNSPLGLIFNFYELVLTKGISRCMLPGANQE